MGSEEDIVPYDEDALSVMSSILNKTGKSRE
jgi:hypothetical protein